MKVISLVSENIKKIRALEIKPTGPIVTIAGRNGQGKTSVLDSIWLALQMSDAKIGTPIRKGEKKARVKIDFGDLVVERRFTESGSVLTVSNREGAVYKSPQKMLDDMIGKISFDPFAFTRIDARKQFDELRKIAKIELDIDALNLANKTDYEKRTVINRDAKNKRTQSEAMPIRSDLPAEAVDEKQLLNDMQAAAAENAETERRAGRRETARQQIVAQRNKAIELKGQADDLRARAAEMDNAAQAQVDAADELQKQLDAAPPLPPAIDITALRKAVDEARVTNAAILQRDQRELLIKQAEELEKQSEALTAGMAARDKQMADAMTAAKMPVQGLGFGDGEVTYNGVPFQQASAAEQLSVSMAIAMATNPKVRVIRITEGSLLDEDSMAALEVMAKANDFQIWCERVDSSGKVGIVIEDGEVVAVNEQDQPELTT
jgi:hypothetical protein